MDKQKKVIIALVAVVIVVGGYFIFKSKSSVVNKQINLNAGQDQGPANQGNVSPISGVACDAWNRRPVAVMQPADPTARPAAGFSDADMVFEMPVFTNSNNRLMGVYLCNVPKEMGSIRSARHDYLPLASSLDAIFVHWGYSKFAEELLKGKIVDNIDGMVYGCSGAGCTGKYINRWQKTGLMSLEDTGYITNTQVDQAMKDFNFHTDNKFSGYPHQAEVVVDQRSNGGNLRLAYPGKYDVEYDYDKVSNSYLRTWDGSPDTDKNNGKRVAPKNIVVMTAEDAQITLASEQSFKDKGLMDPWSLVPADDQAGLDYGGVGRYNNLQIGDPWFDAIDSGDAYFYFNGQQMHGKWKKDKSKLNSKLTFYNDDGSEVKFVPG